MKLIEENATLPRDITDKLTLGEQTGTNMIVRMHPAVIAWPVISAVIGLLGVIVIAGLAGSAKVFMILLVFWSVLAVRALIKFAGWAVDYFIVIPTRVILITGLVNRRTAMMPLGKITDMVFNQSWTGRILNYGEFEIESAGQDQALRTIPFVPFPNDVYRRIVSLLYPDGKDE